MNELWEWDSKINALLLQKLLLQTNDHKVRLKPKNKLNWTEVKVQCHFKCSVDSKEKGLVLWN